MQPNSPEASRIAQQEQRHGGRSLPDAPPAPRTPPAMLMATLFVAMVVMLAVLL